jgi:hypothetical protein
MHKGTTDSPYAYFISQGFIKKTCKFVPLLYFFVEAIDGN